MCLTVQGLCSATMAFKTEACRGEGDRELWAWCIRHTDISSHSTCFICCQASDSGTCTYLYALHHELEQRSPHCVSANLLPLTQICLPCQRPQKKPGMSWWWPHLRLPVARIKKLIQK